MGLRAHVQQLTTKHADIDRQIISEMRRPHPDTLRISELKREKLLIKDKINGYES